MSGKRSRCLCIIMQEPNTLSDLSNSSPPEVAASWPSSSVIFVPTLLFISMFGKESACLNSPIVILCTNSGCVYTFVVKILPNASTRGLGVICELGCEIAGFLPVHVGRTEGEEAAENETANAAITAVLNRGHTQHASEKLEAGLVILSITGEGCLYLPKSLESSYPLVLMFTLPHPVKCCIVYDNSMVCSTGWSLEKYELTLTRQVEDGILAVTFVSKTPLRQAGIQELLHLSVENQTDRTMIAGIASNLEAIHICTVPREDWSGIQRSTFQSIIDTLHSIEQLSLELKSIKEKAQSSDSFLLQMNFFANLVHYGKSQKESQEMSSKILNEAGLSESFLSCHCSILSSLNVYGWNWSLKVTLLNNSPVSLSGDWVIVISLHDMEWHSVQSGKQSLCFNCSLPLLTGLKSRSSFSISIPLDQVARNHLIPVFELSVSLVLNLKDYDTLSTDLSTNILQKGLKVEVYRQKFDILHFSQKQNSQELDGNSGSEDTAIKNSSDMEWLHYELSKIAHMRDTASHFVGDSTQRVITT